MVWRKTTELETLRFSWLSRRGYSRGGEDPGCGSLEASPAVWEVTRCRPEKFRNLFKRQHLNAPITQQCWAVWLRTQDRELYFRCYSLIWLLQNQHKMCRGFVIDLRTQKQFFAGCVSIDFRRGGSLVRHTDQFRVAPDLPPSSINTFRSTLVHKYRIIAWRKCFLFYSEASQTRS